MQNQSVEAERAANVPESSPEHSTGLVLLIPVFNDWGVVKQLLPLVDRELAGAGLRARLVLVDDGSTTPCPDLCPEAGFDALDHVEVLRLRGNLGHQRALAVGLCHIESNVPCGSVLVMDGDGEDSPADIPRLVEKMNETDGKRIIFAERTRRSESMVFKFFYWLFRMVHVLLTGISVRVGNFSIVPRPQLNRLVVVSHLWSHYAAAVREARLPIGSISTRREKRLNGESKMNFLSLVTHGLSAVAVFGPRIGVRMLIATSVLVGLTVVALATAVFLKTMTELAIPGWTTYTVGLLVVILLQMMMFSTVFVFLILAGRNASGFLPIRDYAYFIAESKLVYPRE